MPKPIEELFYTFWYDRPLLGCILIENSWYWFVCTNLEHVDDVYELNEEVHDKLVQEIALYKANNNSKKHPYGCFDSISEGPEGLNVIYEKEELGSLIYKPLDRSKGLEVRDEHKKIGITDLINFYSFDEESPDSLNDRIERECKQRFLERNK